MGENLAKRLDSGGNLVVDDKHFLCNNFMEQLGFVTEEQTLKYVSSIKGGSSPGYDGITAGLLKDNVQYFLKPLTHRIYNLNLGSGVVPNKFKVAKVIVQV